MKGNWKFGKLLCILQCASELFPYTSQAPATGENFLSMLDPLFSQEFPVTLHQCHTLRIWPQKQGETLQFSHQGGIAGELPETGKKNGARGFPEAFPIGSNVAHVHLALRCVYVCVCVTPRRALPHTLKHTFKIAHRGKTSTLFNSDRFFLLHLAPSLLHQTCLPVSV